MFTRIGEEVWVVHEGRLVFAGTVKRADSDPSGNGFYWVVAFRGSCEKDWENFEHEDRAVDRLVKAGLYHARRGTF